MRPTPLSTATSAVPTRRSCRDRLLDARIAPAAIAPNTVGSAAATNTAELGSSLGGGTWSVTRRGAASCCRSPSTEVSRSATAGRPAAPTTSRGPRSVCSKRPSTSLSSSIARPAVSLGARVMSKAPGARAFIARAVVGTNGVELVSAIGTSRGSRLLVGQANAAASTVTKAARASGSRRCRTPVMRVERMSSPKESGRSIYLSIVLPLLRTCQERLFGLTAPARRRRTGAGAAPIRSMAPRT